MSEPLDPDAIWDRCDPPDTPPEPPCPARAAASALIRYNCDCLPAGPDGKPMDGDDAIYCQRWVVLADELEAALAPCRASALIHTDRCVSPRPVGVACQCIVDRAIHIDGHRHELLARCTDLEAQARDLRTALEGEIALENRHEAEVRALRAVLTNGGVDWPKMLAIVAERDALQAEVDAWVRKVPDPDDRLALHYDGCPFRPYADAPSWDTPEDAPECTCAERHKAAYWKSRWVLRGTEMLIRERDLQAEVQKAREENGVLLEYHRTAASFLEDYRRLQAEVRRLQAALDASPGDGV